MPASLSAHVLTRRHDRVQLPCGETIDIHSLTYRQRVDFEREWFQETGDKTIWKDGAVEALCALSLPEGMLTGDPAEDTKLLREDGDAATVDAICRAAMKLNWSVGKREETEQLFQEPAAAG